MNTKVESLNHNELVVGCIVLKNNKPVITMKETIIDLLLHPELYSPIIITGELLEKIGFTKSVNPINKDVYYDIDETMVRVIHDSKKQFFSMNLKYSIKLKDRKLEGGLILSQLSQLQFFLIYFYEMELKPEALLKRECHNYPYWIILNKIYRCIQFELSVNFTISSKSSL